MGHLARWLTGQRSPLGSMDEMLIERFVPEHLPDCKGPVPSQRAEVGMGAVLVHLLQVLRANHCIAGPRLGPPAIHDERERFESHPDCVGGLATATRTSRRMCVRTFLLDRFGDGPVSVGGLKPGDIADFLRAHCDGYKRGAVMSEAPTMVSLVARTTSLPAGRWVSRLRLVAGNCLA